MVDKTPNYELIVMAEKYDTIIIGAGMSGLAAGIRLAYYDRKVLICEQHTIPGGLNSYYIRNKNIIDVGLHAMTNFVTKEQRFAPLNKLCRQLKIKRDEFKLNPQNHSIVRFPECDLIFSNDIGELEKQISEKFPGQLEGFLKLRECVENYDALSLANSTYTSSRKKISHYLSDSLLINMLLCPLMYYGSSWEEDMDFSQFVIMFKSIFLEGFARPSGGVKRIIDILKKKYLDNGGGLRLKCKVKNILVRDSKASGVRLESGEELFSENIISSSGICETGSLVGKELFNQPAVPGELSFTEVILFLKEPLAKFGYNYTIMFYSDQNEFRYRKPEDPVDLLSGVICSPNNFQYSENEKTDPILRITNIANHSFWKKDDKKKYYTQKEFWLEKIIEKASALVPLKKENIIFTDMFTPDTIKRFTGHVNGAVYGSPEKIKHGRTCIENLFICGTDQGFLGIVGAMLSGISMANYHCLK